MANTAGHPPSQTAGPNCHSRSSLKPFFLFLPGPYLTVLKQITVANTLGLGLTPFVISESSVHPDPDTVTERPSSTRLPLIPFCYHSNFFGRNTTTRRIGCSSLRRAAVVRKR